jgi:hypothetical protein
MASKRKKKKLRTNKSKNDSSIKKSAITRMKNKKLRTINKKNNSSKVRSRLMNEDVMTKILSNLSVEELLKLERVSQQFKYCVNEVLKRQKGLSVGKINPEIICCQREHSIIGGNVSNAFVTKKVNSKGNPSQRQNLESILKKCNNIRCLYLNESLDFETIESIVKKCKRLECLVFDDIFLQSESLSKRIGPLFSKSTIFHLSVNHFNGDRMTIDEKNAALVRNMPLLSTLKLLQKESFKNTLDCVQSKNIQYLKVSTYIMVCETQRQQEIDSVVSLINRNEQIIKQLSIGICVTDQDINNINSNKIDLKFLAIRCWGLSLGSVFNLVQSQKMLQRLDLRGFDINQSIGNFNFAPKVRILSLYSCRLRPKQFSQFILLFRLLDTFRFCFSSFRCECIPIADENNCKICNDCGYDVISRVSTIKSLAFICLRNGSSLIDSIPNYKNLNTIEIYAYYPFDFRLFIEKCVNFAQRNPSKLFTIKLHLYQRLEGLPKELPTNIRLIYITEC